MSNHIWRACRYGASLIMLLVVVSPTASAWTANEVEELSSGELYPPLPEAITSFGAAVHDGWVYVYSGHTGRAHQHSRDNLSKRFQRLHLTDPDSWQDLAFDGVGQGLALVASGKYLYRVGGLDSLNAAGEDSQYRSLDTFSRYDPAKNEWTRLTPLPEPRSSHDAMVLDGHIYVVGGWSLHTEEGETKSQWHQTAYTADLDQDPIVWKALPEPPFLRRALALAATSNLVYVVGGLDAEGKTSNRVDVFDVRKQTWSQGPDLPAEGRMKAFGCSAFAVRDHVYASAADGTVYRIAEGAADWESTGRKMKERRFFHRLLRRDDQSLVILGGASRSSHLTGIEVFELDGEVTGSIEGQWPSFRGRGLSHSVAGLPLHWSDESVTWSHAIEGYGQSSPVVWGDRIFITSVVGEEKDELKVVGLDLETGRQLWSYTGVGTQKVKSSDYVSRAAPTPAVDSQGVYAFFESGDVIALDHEGGELWKRSLTADYGDIKGNHGLGTSIVQSSSALYVLAEHEGPSYLVCLSKETGENLWKVDREPRVSWSTPYLHSGEHGEELIVSSNGVVEAFDADTGKRLWYVEGLEGNTVASPSVSNGIVMAGSSQKGHSMAIRGGGEGNVEETHVLWRAKDALSGFGSPLVVDDRVYTVNKAGVARCLILETGEELWSERVGGSCWASPMASGDHVYFFVNDGLSVVFDVSQEQPRKVGESTLTVEGRVYGVAPVPGALLIRTGSRLLCVGRAEGVSGS